MKIAWVLLMLTTYDGEVEVYSNVVNDNLTEDECRDTLEYMPRLKSIDGENIIFLCQPETD
jgi:hypothetical protein